ncbi:CYTH domain-containing protein [Bacillus sp. V59.32b]|uniref:CYTH domain-containing protein n=1 Tax=Bacillus sp. V59.32b TaxID=1758642 RepID=UPI000E3C762B|nr:CYTH domain-containing protein [Bacillus sp. V59.32b]RFU63059.1 CYTH domain-containing protein [Bacillus sp. V59.32b]
MDQHIEIEFKNLLYRNEFDKLMEHFNVAETDFTTQLNHYFDTPLFELKDQKSALRIREKNERYELTLKQPAKDGLLETNLELTKKQADSILKGTSLPESGIAKLIETMGISPKNIQYFGTLQTNRAELQYQGGLLVLDHSTYLNEEDYEVEYEVTNKTEGQNIFINLLKNLNIPARTTENKIRRLYNAMINK